MLRVALITGALLLSLLAVEVLRPRDYLTGTNGAGSVGHVVPVGAGQELCVGGLDVPPGTERARLRSAQGEMIAAPSPRVCVRPGAATTFAGRPGVETDEEAPTLDGQPLPFSVDVAFLPAEGARKSLLAQLPDIARRAALFRPEPVGAWTYWAILLVVLPALAVGAMVLLVRAPRRAAVLVGALAFGVSACWALVMPPFNAPDETEHFAYAQNLAERWTVPETDPPGTRRPYSSEQQLAWEGAGVRGQLGQREGRPPWLAVEERRWRRRVATEEPSPDDGGGPITGSAYTPTYYALTAPAYHAGGSIFGSLTLMRLVSALLAAIAAGCVVALVREGLPEPRWPAIGAGLLVAFQPMFSFMGGVVNNDAAVNAAAAALLLVLVRALRRGLSPRLAAGAGALTVAALVAKGSGAFLAPAAVLAVALAQPHRWRALAAGVGAAALVWGVLALSTDRTLNPVTPARVAASNVDFPTAPGPEVDAAKALEHPGDYASHVWQLFLPPLPFMEDLRAAGHPRPGYTVYVKRAFAAFGFAAILFPGWVYALIALAMAAVAVLAVLAARRERDALRRRAAPAAVLALAGLTVILGAEAVWFNTEPGGTLGSYGRYAFPALAPAATLVAAACFGAGRRGAPAVMAGLVTAMVVLNLASFWLVISALYV